MEALISICTVIIFTALAVVFKKTKGATYAIFR